MSDLVERLSFDASRCELQFSKGVAGNIEEAIGEIKHLREQLVCAIDILQSLFPLHRMVTEQHADKHDAVPIGWTIDLGTIRRASKFIITQVSQSDDFGDK